MLGRTPTAPRSSGIDYWEPLLIDFNLPLERLVEKFSELGASSVDDLIDLTDEMKASLELKPLEEKRFAKALLQFCDNSRKSHAQGQLVEAKSASLTEAAASATARVSLETETGAKENKAQGPTLATVVATSTAESSAVRPSKALMQKKEKLTKSKVEAEEILILNDPILSRMSESDGLFLLREVRGCHFRAKEYTAANGRKQLTLRGSRAIMKKAGSFGKGKVTKMKESYLLSDIRFGDGPWLVDETLFTGDCWKDAINRCILIGHRFVVCSKCHEVHHESKMAAHNARVHQRSAKKGSLKK